MQTRIASAELVRPIVEGQAEARTLLLRDDRTRWRRARWRCSSRASACPGEPLAALAIARDVSERLDTQARLRRLAEAEHARAAELNAVIRAMGDGVLVCATDGAVRLANPAVRDVLGGATPATYGARSRRSTMPAGAPELGTRGGPTELRLAGDEERWVELATYPVGVLPGQTRHETIVVVRDVTDARMSQALRETFVGVLSHELRTPITTIFGGAKILARNGNLADEQRQAIFTDIHVEAERLHRLVEDVIALTRFGEDGLDIGHEPVLLQRILPGIVAAEEARWPGASFSVDVAPGLPTVVADPTYVEQVVRNLLSNAAKYGGDGVRDARSSPRRDGDEVTVRILDDGPGFPDDEVGPPVRAVLPLAADVRAGVGRRDRPVRVRPAHPRDGWADLGGAAAGRRRGVRVRAAPDGRGRPGVAARPPAGAGAQRRRQAPSG